VYTITDDSAEPYIHPDFTVSPDYCPIVYEYSVSTLVNNGESAITQDPTNDKKFSFFYNQDLVPIGDS
jgi:hypothetical protein